MRNIDVVIVGAGPAGLAAAIAVRQRGPSVLVTDGLRPPIDKACGEGLMPAGVNALRRLGISVESPRGFAFTGIRFIEGEFAPHGEFGGPFGLGIRRTILHQLLVARASEIGVETRWGAPAARLSNETVLIGGQEIAFRWLIGADGHNSRVREFARLRQTRGSRRRIGFRRHYRARPWSECVEVHWCERCQAYVTPVGAEEIDVALVGEDHAPRPAELPQLFPALWERLRHARPSSATRGGVSASISLRAVVRGNVALVGDASGSVDAITGDGLSLALAQAHALAEAIERDDLARYQRSHREIARMARLMSRVLLMLADHGRLRRRVISAFAAEPAFFSRFLAAHAGVIAPLSVGAGTVARLGWRLLRPGMSTRAISTRDHDGEEIDNMLGLRPAVGDDLFGPGVAADGSAGAQPGPDPD